MCSCVCGWVYLYYCFFFFFFKQKTAYEMRISDWSSDVCSSDLAGADRTDEDGKAAHFPDQRLGQELHRALGGRIADHMIDRAPVGPRAEQIGRASCRERVCQYV